MSRVELIPGWYSDTLNQGTQQRLPLRAAAIVNVDCDVYESTVPVLQFIERYLVDGSVIIFDDWYCFANRAELGEQKAFKEWLQKNPHLNATPYKEFGWDGKALSSTDGRPLPSFRLISMAMVRTPCPVQLRSRAITCFLCS